VTEVAYAWVADGIGTIFVTDEGLDTAWAVAAGFETTLVGLRLPRGLACGVDLRSGLLTDDTATIEIDDLDGSLAGLFRADRADTTPLITTVEPGDVAPIPTRGRHVGLERIGAAGERRLYSCVPGFAVGLKHYGANEAFSNELGATPISADPVLWAGRRCAVYRVERVGGTWQSLAASKRVWWGTMRGRGSYSRGRWSLACYGPQSWLGGNLGRGVFAGGLPVRAAVAVADPRIWSNLDVIRLTNLDIKHTYANFSDLPDDTYLVGAEGYDDVAAAINAYLADLEGYAVGPDKPFDENGNGLRFSTTNGAEGITIRWVRGATLDAGDPYTQAGDPNYTARLILQAHETVWAALGYDVRIQNNVERDAVDQFEQYGTFEPAGLAGFWIGKFYAAQPSVIKAFDNGTIGQAGNTDEDYGDVIGRRWPTLYPGGSTAFTGEPLQEFEIISPDPLLLPNTKARPLPADPDDESSPYVISEGVGAVNAQALMVLDGPYRRRGDKDAVDPVEGYAFELERERREGRTVQVVRVAYRRNADGTASIGTGANPRLVIVQWYAPRVFGIDFQPLDGTWGGFFDAPPGAPTIQAYPLVAWDVRDTGDKVSEVLQRVILTTGTAGEWYGDQALTVPLYGSGGGAMHLDRGDNDTGGLVPKDAEDATLGLGVPASMVRAPGHWTQVEGVLGEGLKRCKVASASVLSARDLFSRVLSPTGLALSLAGGRYGLIDAWALPTPQDASLVITTELYGGRAGDPGSARAVQSLRKWAPIDRLEVKGRADPQTGEYEVEVERPATDGGAVYRSEQIRHAVTGDYLMHSKIGPAWLGDLATRWRSGFQFWSDDHALVTVKLHAADALDVWPGAGVLITDPELLSASGVYGVSTAAARVIARDFSAERETVSLTMLVGNESAMRLYAPAALVTSYDAGADRLYCADDWLGDRDGDLDVSGFAEPSYSSEGGSASVEVLQFDGVEWSGGIYGTVASVQAVQGSCYLQLAGPLTGATYYRDKLTIVVLREWANQSAAWVKRWHAPICESDGTHSGGTPGIPFVEQ